MSHKCRKKNVLRDILPDKKYNTGWNNLYCQMKYVVFARNTNLSKLNKTSQENKNSPEYLIVTTNITFEKKQMLAKYIFGFLRRQYNTWYFS